MNIHGDSKIKNKTTKQDSVKLVENIHTLRRQLAIPSYTLFSLVLVSIFFKAELTLGVFIK